jgi:hypothetical protein
MILIKNNTWVQIEKIVLKPEERTGNIPEDTKKVPLRMWVKGWLQADAEMGQNVIITTVTGRLEGGLLVASNPSYQHNYGDFVPEIQEIDKIVKKALYGANHG